VLVTSNAHTINPALRPQMPFDSVKDFTPLTLLAASPNVLLVRVESPIKTVDEYVAAAKAKPGVVSTATSGVGTSLHILSEQFSYVAGLKLNHIPYTNSAQSVGALLGGQVDSSWNAINAALPHIKAGKLRALAVASGKRSSFLPDLTTFEEAGFKGVVSETWLGALGPANLPAPIAQKLNAEFVKLIGRPDIRDKILALGAEPVGIELDRFAQLIRSEIADYTQTVKAANIRAE
jgi:tripartite-type tricarboxylate transporter receptor subunit TctC